MTTEPNERRNETSFDATLRVRVPVYPTTGRSGVTVECREAPRIDGGDVVFDLAVEISAPGESHDSKTSAGLDGVRSGADGGDRRSNDETTPPHRDPEKLRAVYEAHDTFTEMTAALGTDVTPETVRTQMINHGIHTPYATTNRPAPENNESRAETKGPADGVTTNGDGDMATGGTPDVNGRSAKSDGGTVLEAGRSASRGASATAAQEPAPEPEAPVERLPTELGLPDDVTVTDLVELVSGTQTCYEFQRALGTDATSTRRLLSELDLVDLVYGRIATRNARNAVPRDEIRERIERAISNGHHSDGSGEN